MHQHGFTIGESVPPVIARTAGAPRFTLDEGAGRWVMVLVPGPGVAAGAVGCLDAMIAPHAACLHPDRALLVVIATDPGDPAARRLAAGAGRHLLWDDHGTVLGALRAIRPDGTVRHGWLLLDPSRRVFGFWPLEQGADAMATLAALPPPEAHAGVPLTAPVLIVPRVFEPAFCRRLIGLCRTRGTDDVADDDAAPHRRRRRTLPLEAQELQVQIRGRISMRLLPEIRRAFAFDASRMERYLVACYDAQGRGFYGPHRDNDEAGTAHRAFAVTINLNGGEYDGGDLCFPEYGPQTYRAPLGGALVHSCSLLHEVRPMKRGRRYACVLFVFDEEGERMRTASRKLTAATAA
jgi:predicted 2-oxoglutarate/Fe(II)-dependent dioxygenase YbiX